MSSTSIKLQCVFSPPQKSVFAQGFSGIPGSNGIPGMPGIPGAPGPQGQQGKDGAKGEPGVKGPRGMTGTRGLKGNPGSLGKNGAPGMMGIKGDKGHEGSRGSSGPPGIKGVKGEQGSKGEKGEIVNSAVSQTNWKQCVWKNGDGRNSGKIKVQKYLKNSMKNDLSINANLSWPSLKETLRNAAKLKISINNSVHSCRLQKYEVIIQFFLYHSFKIFLIYFYCSYFLFFCIHGIFYRIAHSTSCSLIQLLKSHSREIRESMAVQVNATGGSSSLMEMNAVDQ